MPDDAIDRLHKVATDLQNQQVQALREVVPQGGAPPIVLESTAGSAPASTAGGISVVPNVAVDLSAPNTLDASTRSWMAKAMVVLAVVALGIAVAGLVLGNEDTDPGSMPVLCVVVAMIATVGAVIITLGYGSVKLGTGTNAPTAPASSSTSTTGN